MAVAGRGGRPANPFAARQAVAAPREAFGVLRVPLDGHLLLTIRPGAARDDALARGEAAVDIGSLHRLFFDSLGGSRAADVRGMRRDRHPSAVGIAKRAR